MPCAFHVSAHQSCHYCITKTFKYCPADGGSMKKGEMMSIVKLVLFIIFAVMLIILVIKVICRAIPGFSCPV
jgi:TRAP-type C4-dicarboxylate transport system permease small subunit